MKSKQSSKENDQPLGDLSLNPEFSESEFAPKKLKTPLSFNNNKKNISSSSLSRKNKPQKIKTEPSFESDRIVESSEERKSENGSIK